MNQPDFRLYFVDFATQTANAVIRYPGATLCAEILQINPTEFDQIRREAIDGTLAPAVIQQLSKVKIWNPKKPHH